ncbi:WhiB family transcriptional regulator [Rhodococcus sp. NPDC057529]|uniref:WhiB family transcriptional regulator n=1 Tax=Rhodococcus sp. NPDC057529 TaxID=3346158 RepID=UPI00366BCFF8
MTVTPIPRGSYAAAEPDEWRIYAVCRDADPDLFFPDESTTAQRRASVEHARRHCNQCPVARTCLDQAIARGENFGIWAGHDFKDSAVRTRFQQETQAA